MQEEYIHILEPFNPKLHKAICFIDVDGTITPGPSSWEHLHEVLGTAKEAEKNTTLFFEGKIDYDEWAKRDVNLWKGRKKEEIEKALEEIEVRKDADKAVKKLRKLGCYIILISGGLRALVERIAIKVGAHAFSANDIIYDEKGKVLRPIAKVAMNKELVAEEILQRLGINGKKLLKIAIGDSINDISLFKWADYSIAVDPTHEEVYKNSHEMVNPSSFCDITEKIERWLNKKKEKNLFKKI